MGGALCDMRRAIRMCHTLSTSISLQKQYNGVRTAVFLLKIVSSVCWHDLNCNYLNMSQKKALRKAIAATLNTLAPAVITAQSDAVTARVLASSWWRDASIVCLYLAMPKELQTRGLLEAAFANGKKVLVPRITGKAATDMVVLEAASLKDVDAFPLDKWDIPDPPDVYLDGPRCGSPRADWRQLVPDLVLVPGVAFDAHCNRLGHGKGYYDAWISQLRAQAAAAGKPCAALVGLSFEEQLLAAADGSGSGSGSGSGVPLDPDGHDQPLTAVITPSAVYIREASSTSSSDNACPAS